MKKPVERLTTMTVGNTLIIFDYSYVDSRTEEQAKIDREMLTEAVYTICKPDDVVDEAV